MGVQSVHVDSVHEDYIQRAATGGLFGDTLVIVLERDHSPKCDEKEKEKNVLKSVDIPANVVGVISRKGNQFVLSRSLCTCVTIGYNIPHLSK